MKIAPRLTQKIADAIPLPVRAAVINFRAFVRGKPYRVSIRTEETPPLFDIKDRERTLTIARIHRANRSKPGVMRGVDVVARQYGLDTLAHLSGGTFIDCGANIGELGLWARARDHAYIAFEPEPMEARCCDLNNFDGADETHRAALWKENTTLTFYHDPDTADSSVFEGAADLEKTEVPAVTLDHALGGQELTSPVIFKLEAEGAEPEILEGATETLKRIDWIAVDCGPERGASNDNTFVAVHDALLAAGFALREVRPQRLTTLYERVK
ncbi:MAG: FkbM family methyltransferase [Pseudomonadota bacterium]